MEPFYESIREFQHYMDTLVTHTPSFMEQIA